MEYSAVRRLGSKLLQSPVVTCCLSSPGLLFAGDVTVIGGTSVQQRLAACIEHVSAEELNRLPGPDHSMTVVILDRQRFQEVKGSFHAYRTQLAFSNMAIRRIYLSSDVFKDQDTATRCIPHELGHFLTRSVYEYPAEIAAGRIRQRALEVCTMWEEPAQSHTLSSQARAMRPGETK